MKAAANMHLAGVEFDPFEYKEGADNSRHLLTWVKSYVAAGDPVAIGIYANQYLFSGAKNPDAGWHCTTSAFCAYDHIVPVAGVSSSHPLWDTGYYSSDTITFNDNGEWDLPNGQPQYVFTYPFGSFQATRKQANAHTGAVYSLPDDEYDYAIAITGVLDPDHETLPVRVATNVNYEKPGIKNGTSIAPLPMPLTLTITVSGLTPGVVYNLYRYNAMSQVPNGAFNANAAQAYEHWPLTITSGSTYTMTEQIMSDDVAAYRAVPASAL
jgi:hypothetical protein